MGNVGLEKPASRASVQSQRVDDSHRALSAWKASLKILTDTGSRSGNPIWRIEQCVKK